MSLIVEDGTGKADAESYISAADATAYHAARGNTTWAQIPNDQKEQLLRKATDYMLQAYRARWGGYRMSSTQALDWPRYNVPMKDAPGAIGYGGLSYYPTETVPTAIARACAELALKALAGDLVADGAQATKREKIGPLEIEYQNNSAAGANYTAIDGMLSPFFAGANGMIAVVRG